MRTFAGLDVSQAKTTICIVDERGGVAWRGSCATVPDAIVQALAKRTASLERVGLESGPLTPWLVHELRALGLPVVCLDARHAQAALSVQINKSDANDADGLAQIVRTRWLSTLFTSTSRASPRTQRRPPPEGYGVHPGGPSAVGDGLHQPPARPQPG